MHARDRREIVLSTLGGSGTIALVSDSFAGDSMVIRAGVNPFCRPGEATEREQQIFQTRSSDVRRLKLPSETAKKEGSRRSDPAHAGCYGGNPGIWLHVPT